MKRSDFLKTLGLGAVGALTSNQLLAAGQPVASDGANGAQQPEASSRALGPMSIGTWPFAEHTTRAALDAMKKGVNALDAVELGVKICEADPRERSVGLGGRPDRDGRVTLDACIMDHLGNIGSVAACEQVVHVSSLARAVMERTPHVMLVGDGATQFAKEQGFPMQNLLVAESEAEWKK
jgi:N4-(beta-N-acetylglucosaminyl)-L-asparaginase